MWCLTLGTFVGLGLGMGLFLRSSEDAAAGLAESLCVSFSESMSGNLEVSMDVGVGTENKMNRSRNCSLTRFDNLVVVRLDILT